MRAITIVGSGLVLLLAACGSSTGAASATATSAPPTVVVTKATTTTSTTTTTTTTTVPLPPPAPQSSPYTASQALLAAWDAGDRQAALTVASVAAVDALFARPPEPTEGRGCQQPLAGTSDCSYSIKHRVLITIRTVDHGDGWLVDSVSFS